MEIEISKIPLPLINYVYLIKDKKSPYFDVVRYIVKEMEFHYRNAQLDGRSEVVYTINPRKLADEIDILVRNKSRLTVRSVCLTILAFYHLSGLKEGEDFYKTTTSRGRRNYHFKVNQRTLSSFARIL